MPKKMDLGERRTPEELGETPGRLRRYRC
jgi:hypothetical protein